MIQKRGQFTDTFSRFSPALEHRVTVLKNGVNVGCNLFVAPQCSGAIPGNCLGRHFDLHSQSSDASMIACVMSLARVSLLPPASSTIEVASSDKIHAIPWPIIDPQFRDAGTNRLNVARVSKAQSVDPSLYA